MSRTRTWAYATATTKKALCWRTRSLNDPMSANEDASRHKQTMREHLEGQLCLVLSSCTEDLPSTFKCVSGYILPTDLNDTGDVAALIPMVQHQNSTAATSNSNSPQPPTRPPRTSSQRNVGKTMLGRLCGILSRTARYRCGSHSGHYDIHRRHTANTKK